MKKEALIEKLIHQRQQGLQALPIVQSLLSEGVSQESLARNFVDAFKLDDPVDRIYDEIRLWNGKNPDNFNNYLERRLMFKRLGGRPTMENVANFYGIGIQELLQVLESLTIEKKLTPYMSSKDGIETHGYVITVTALIEIDSILNSNQQKPPWWSW